MMAKEVEKLTSEELADRIESIIGAITDGKWGDLYMSIPAQPTDADIVLKEAARRLRDGK